MAGNLVNRETVDRFEALMREHIEPVNLRPQHDFCDGLYLRTLTVPKGVVVVGAIHKTENYFFVRTGKVAIWTEDGAKLYESGDVIRTSVGIKRVAYAIEDSVLSNVFFNPANETDPEELWDMITVIDYDQLDTEITLAIEGLQ